VGTDPTKNVVPSPEAMPSGWKPLGSEMTAWKRARVFATIIATITVATTARATIDKVIDLLENIMYLLTIIHL
jgi:hypothetical protein